MELFTIITAYFSFKVMETIEISYYSWIATGIMLVPMGAIYLGWYFFKRKNKAQ